MSPGARGDTIRIEPEIVRVLTRLRQLPPAEMGYACVTVLEELEGLNRAIRDLYAGAVRSLRADGVTWADITEMVGAPSDAALMKLVERAGLPEV